MSTYLEDLNEVQRQAVACIAGPVMVIAGPGSGKTRVLTTRIAHMVSSGIAPYNILALTFTNKAAKEMKERIKKVVGNKANYVKAGTFHSVFAGVLRREADKIGYPSNYTIYDSTDQRTLIKNIIKEMNLDNKTYKDRALAARISAAKCNLTTPKMYANNEDLISRDRINKRPWTHKIYSKYQELLIKNGAMDFDDLLLMMYRLLYENKENVIEKYRSIFRYLLVDEFQDTNFLQYAILKKLAKYKDSPENICIVGDDAQSIYAFRGATIENILNFEKDFPHTKTFKLEQNYRSTEHIVEAANELITQNSNQIKKTIWSDKKQGNKIKLIKSTSDIEEGRRIANIILEYKNLYHLHYSDIAILYRTNAQSRIFEEQLRKQNIRYKVYGGLSFYQRKEIKDLIAYLRLVVNPDDDEALKRIINTPRRGIGKSTLGKVVQNASEREMSTLESLKTVPAKGRAGKAISKFYKMMRRFIAYEKDHDALECIRYIYKESGMYHALTEDKTVEGIGRVDNINSLLDGVAEFVESDDIIVDPLNENSEENAESKSLASYLQNIALITDLDQDEEDDNHVTLMSAHAAKGLEFKMVCVVGLEEKLFPSFMAMDSVEAIAEERRLFYVALTRAEEQLVLSYANSRYQYGRPVYNQVSRFVYEIEESHFENPVHLNGVSETVNHVKGNGAMSSTASKGSSYQKVRRKTSASLLTDEELKNFVVSPVEEIKVGKAVLHKKFGKGKVLEIDGSHEKKVASIRFDQASQSRKRLMLKFAKLQVLS